MLYILCENIWVIRVSSPKSEISTKLENLVRLAEATTDPAQREECLARARELAQGKLLPEFPYDKHIEKYGEYYRRLGGRLFGEGAI